MSRYSVSFILLLSLLIVRFAEAQQPTKTVGYLTVSSLSAEASRLTASEKVYEGCTPHNARDLGPETGRMLSTYIVETGQPIATFVDKPVQR